MSGQKACRAALSPFLMRWRLFSPYREDENERRSRDRRSTRLRARRITDGHFSFHASIRGYFSLSATCHFISISVYQSPHMARFRRTAFILRRNFFFDARGTGYCAFDEAPHISRRAADSSHNSDDFRWPRRLRDIFGPPHRRAHAVGAAAERMGLFSIIAREPTLRNRYRNDVMTP